MRKYTLTNPHIALFRLNQNGDNGRREMDYRADNKANGHIYRPILVTDTSTGERHALILTEDGSIKLVGPVPAGARFIGTSRTDEDVNVPADYRWPSGLPFDPSAKVGWGSARIGAIRTILESKVAMARKNLDAGTTLADILPMVSKAANRTLILENAWKACDGCDGRPATFKDWAVKDQEMAWDDAIL